MSEGRKVPVVVSMSGKFELEVGDGPVTAAALIERAAALWGVSEEELFEPFVVSSDMVKGGHKCLEAGDDVLADVSETSMLRVALPLRAKD